MSWRSANRKPKSGQAEVTGGAFQQLGDRSEADQGGGLIERRALDLRCPQQTDRVAPQLGDQLSIAPHRLRTHHGGHRAPPGSVADDVPRRGGEVILGGR